jgi:phosphate transport system substrate-binding protein
LPPRAGAGRAGSASSSRTKAPTRWSTSRSPWAEAYRQVEPNVGIAVSGGGSGTGIAALINGTVDIANASRAITPEEQQKIREAQKVDAKEHTVAIDAVVFFVHKSNPLDKITLEQLACIYG